MFEKKGFKSGLLPSQVPHFTAVLHFFFWLVLLGIMKRLIPKRDGNHLGKFYCINYGYNIRTIL